MLFFAGDAADYGLHRFDPQIQSSVSRGRRSERRSRPRPRRRSLVREPDLPLGQSVGPNSDARVGSAVAPRGTAVAAAALGAAAAGEPAQLEVSAPNGRRQVALGPIYIVGDD